MNITITTRGPIFSPGVTGVVRDAVHDIVQEVTEAGVQRLDEVLRPRPAGVFLSFAEAGKGKASTGHYRRSLHGDVKGTLGRIDDSRVVYGPWLEGTGSRNATTRFKGYHSFRRTAEWLQKEMPRLVKAGVRRLLHRLGG